MKIRTKTALIWAIKSKWEWIKYLIKNHSK